MRHSSYQAEFGAAVVEQQRRAPLSVGISQKEVPCHPVLIQPPGSLQVGERYDSSDRAKQRFAHSGFVPLCSSQSQSYRFDVVN